VRILVVGGTRFIGRATVRRLLDRGEVALLQRGQSGPTPMGAREVRGDRRVPGTIAAAVNEVEPDVILDMCAYFEADGDELVAGAGGRKIVLVSSADVYRNFGGLLGREEGDPDPLPLAEDAPLRSRLYPYRSDGCNEFQHDYDKIPIEKRVLEARGCVVRLPMVYGPGDPQRRLSPLLRQMTADSNRIELPRTEAGWVSCRAHVDDVAAALALAVTSPASNGVYNVSLQDAPSEVEWARSVARAAGWDGEIAEGEDTEEAAGFRWSIALDSSRIRQELGYMEVVRFEDGLFETAEWERAHPQGPPPDSRLQRPRRGRTP
jgi:nucleoside-diphosphate-sugar epimerase